MVISWSVSAVATLLLFQHTWRKLGRYIAEFCFSKHIVLFVIVFFCKLPKNTSQLNVSKILEEEPFKIECKRGWELGFTRSSWAALDAFLIHAVMYFIEVKTVTTLVKLFFQFSSSFDQAFTGGGLSRVAEFFYFQTVRQSLDVVHLKLNYVVFLRAGAISDSRSQGYSYRYCNFTGAKQSCVMWRQQVCCMQVVLLR